MAKLNLSDIVAGFGLTTTYNDNNALIEAAIENTLSRDGTAPNQMEAVLDMNSNRIINLADGVLDQDAVTIKQLNALSLTGLPVGALDDILVHNGSEYASVPQSALSITESQISDLQPYLLTETNDLSSAVTWTNIPDAFVPQSAVTQHEAALTITESQISDLGAYLLDITGEPIGDLSDVFNVGPINNEVLVYVAANNRYENKQLDTSLILNAVTKVGSPNDNEIAVWTGDGTLEGDSQFRWTGTELQILDPGLTDTAAFSNDASNFILELDGLSAFQIASIGAGHSLEVMNPGGTTEVFKFQAGVSQFGAGTASFLWGSFLEFKGSGAQLVRMHNSNTDFVTLFSTTQNWTIEGLSGNFALEDGATLVVQDGTNADSMSQSHDGTNYDFAAVGTADVNFTGLTGRIKQGAETLAFLSEIPGGGGGAQLSDLTDVNTSTPTNRNVLVADGVDWESRALVEADISDLQTYLTAVPDPLQLSDGTAVAPTYSFSGATGLGIFRLTGNTLGFANSGGLTATLAASEFASALAGGPAMRLNAAASSTVPVLLPNGTADPDTGIGWFGADALSHIAGGVEGIRVTETLGNIDVDIFGGLTIHDDGGTDTIVVEHNGTNAVFSGTNISNTIFNTSNDYEFQSPTSNAQFNILLGTPSVLWENHIDVTSVQWEDGDGNLYYTWNFAGTNGAGFTIERGNRLELRGTTGTNTIQIRHDNTDVQILGTGSTGDINIGGITGRLTQGAETFAYQSELFTTADEINDLSAAVTWVNVPDANITQSSVTQHVGAIDHDSLLNFVANEHIDWTADQGATNINNANIELAVNDLTDAFNSIPADRHVLVYDGVTDNRYENRLLVEADISDLQSYLTAEVNDLTAAVTWANIPDANVPASAVTQHVGSIDHDSLLNFVANEHLDWTSDLGATNIHFNNNTLFTSVNQGVVPGSGGGTTNFLRADGTWAAPAGGLDNDAVQARRTTGYTLTTAFVDVTFDATDVETDSAVLDHDLVTNTDNIIIGATGTYLISYDIDLEPPVAAGDTWRMEARVRLNDAGTGINGSQANTTIWKDNSVDGTDFPKHLSNSFIVNLTATDFITLQINGIDESGSGGAPATRAGGMTFKAMRLL